ncbi:hypothetical protein C3V36_02105 [Lachnospiraceae bacterium oral taxon 500]|nr:hypothetical protein C3V36_02105 [Lachnospiraceae bacterium oral taxon 500]
MLVYGFLRGIGMQTHLLGSGQSFHFLLQRQEMFTGFPEVICQVKRAEFSCQGKGSSGEHGKAEIRNNF